jgi:hypothetical protein
MLNLQLKHQRMMVQLLAVNDWTMNDHKLDEILREAVSAEDLSGFGLYGLRDNAILARLRIRIDYDGDGPRFSIHPEGPERLDTEYLFDRFGEDDASSRPCAVWKHACAAFMRVIAACDLRCLWFVQLTRRSEHYRAKYGLGRAVYDDQTAGGERFGADNTEVAGLVMHCDYARTLIETPGSQENSTPDGRFGRNDHRGGSQ